MKVPAVGKVLVKVAEEERFPEVVPSAKVTLCNVALALQVQVTVVPTGTCMSAGEKKSSPIDT